MLFAEEAIDFAHGVAAIVEAYEEALVSFGAAHSSSACWLLRLNAENHQRYRWHAATVSNDIVKLALVVGDAGRHQGLHRLHRQDFNSYVDLVSDVKREVFHEEVVGDKCVFSELNLDCDSAFNEIRLVVAGNRDSTGFQNVLSLRLRLFRQCLSYQFHVVRHPIMDTPLSPLALGQKSLKAGVKVNWTVEDPTLRFSDLFAHLGSARLRVNQGYDLLHFSPEAGLMNEQML